MNHAQAKGHSMHFCYQASHITMMDLLFSILYKQRLKHEIDCTGSLIFRKNVHWQKVSTEVSLCGLRRVTCVDTPCRCISALFLRTSLKYLTNILRIARILCENSPQRSSSKYCLKTPPLTSREALCTVAQLAKKQCRQCRSKIRPHLKYSLILDLLYPQH